MKRGFLNTKKAKDALAVTPAIPEPGQFSIMYIRVVHIFDRKTSSKTCD